MWADTASEYNPRVLQLSVSDGSDSAWIKQRNEYLGIKNDQTQDSRFRDWENLQYWFRGVEKFAPWVNHIYFVTWGHIPSWLNTDHPKLTVVKHEDYIPKQFLPITSLFE